MQRLLPPMLFLPLLVVSVAVGVAVPVVGPLAWPVRGLGVVAIAVGLWLNVGGAAHFQRVETNIVTFRDPTKLVVDGRFAFTRNPMYLGFVLMLVGAALLVGSLTAWIGAVVFFVVADRWYVPFEERRLTHAFGDDFEAYRRRVRRWAGRRREVTP